MKQAFHIFSKDLRRLWLQIALLMLAIGYFAHVDAGQSRLILFNSEPLTVLVGAAVWFLIARAVHEESLPGENQFWLTRPYDRGSLLLSKIMMAVFAVSVPLFVVNCLILSIQSIPVAANLGGLILRQLVIAVWLIVPPFAIASITRTITEDVMVWLFAIAVAGLGYFPGTTIPDFRAFNEKYAITVALALMLAAVWRQYFRRGTMASRALIAVAMLLPTLPFPESAAVAIEGLKNDPAASRITLTVEPGGIAQPPNPTASDLQCVPIAISIGGMRPGWRLAVLSQKDVFESAGKTFSVGWRPGNSGEFLDFNGAGNPQMTNACLNADGFNNLYTGAPITVHTSLALDVFAGEKSILFTAGLQPFDVPGVGRCQLLAPLGEDKSMMACRAPVWLPPPGRVIVGSVEAWNSEIWSTRYEWAPMNLLPGLSPVYSWATLRLDSQLRDAIEQRGELEFRPEKRIAVLRRDLTVSDVAWGQ